jgi:hypothetical protein
MNTVDDIKKLKDQEIGGRITEELSEYLKRWTSGRDRSDAAEKNNITGETLSSIVTRRRNLTENSYPALLALVSIAMLNIDTHSEEAQEADSYLSKLLIT